ncbi:hypothetical protein Taro_005915 [Colocasia esculenta]|uniref:Uncharacterized protein n=1 Tax=Colocasia esculenta TaxID=4460 RepID=A0A843TTS8_COLES|nr:hypothetical protein [Colocasia esculenta]
MKKRRTTGEIARLCTPPAAQTTPPCLPALRGPVVHTTGPAGGPHQWGAHRWCTPSRKQKKKKKGGGEETEVNSYPVVCVPGGAPTPLFSPL